jgi:hypothetical protein
MRSQSAGRQPVWSLIVQQNNVFRQDVYYIIQFRGGYFMDTHLMRLPTSEHFRWRLYSRYTVGLQGGIPSIRISNTKMMRNN